MEDTKYKKLNDYETISDEEKQANEDAFSNIINQTRENQVSKKKRERKPKSLFSKPVDLFSKSFVKSKSEKEKTKESKQKSKQTAKKLFQDARNTLVEKNPRNKSRYKKTLKDCDESWCEYFIRTNRSERKVKLDRYVPTRHCPRCKKIKLKSKQWIILTSSQSKSVGHKCICKSCWMKHQSIISKPDRELILNKHVPTRRCPMCKRIKERSRQWIILSSEQCGDVGHKCICKSCWMIFKNRKENE